jgi:hypothetical protein
MAVPMIGLILAGVFVYLLACLFVATVCGGRRRYPEPKPPVEMTMRYDSREGGWL